MSTVPFIVPVSVIVSLPAPSVTLPVSVPLLLIVVLPDDAMLPVIPPLFVTRKAPPADVMLPVTVAAVFRFSNVLVWLVPAAPKRMSPVIVPVAVDASVTRLPPPIETATLPAGAPTLVMSPSLLTTLCVPAERIGAADVSVVPETVAPGVTLIVSRLIDDWNSLVSAVVQVTVSFVALIRQSAKAAVGVTNAPRPVSAVPSMRYCFAEKRVSMTIAPLLVALCCRRPRAALPFCCLIGGSQRRKLQYVHSC